MSGQILFVDDEVNLLNAIKRQLRKEFNLTTAVGGVEALQIMQNEGPFAVIVSDMQMPKMNGVEFLKEAQKQAPDSVRLMLTGNADQQTATAAVNQGCVFRFLTKPCATEALAGALKAAMEQYRLVTAERELLEGTLNGSIKLLTDVLSIIAPESFGRGVSMKESARTIAQALKLENVWDLELAAMLSQIAYVTIPPDILAKYRAGGSLNDVEEQMIERLPKIGKNLLENIPRLEHVANIVLYHRKNFDGSGFPADAVSGENIPQESRILRVLSDLTGLEEQCVPREDALKRMAGQDSLYDPIILQTASRVLLANNNEVSLDAPIQVAVHGLQAGQMLLSNIETEDGRLLYAAGHRITAAILERLFNYQQITKIKQPIRVYYADEAKN